MPSPNLAALIQRLRVPTPIKLFADSMMGSKEPITEKDFTPDELAEMARLLQESPSGVSDYRQYGGTQPGIPALLTAKGRVVDSLGRFNAKFDPEGATITDKYDFNPTYTKENPLVQALQGLGTGGFSAVHALGEAVLPPGQGRDVNIRVPYGR